MDEDQRQVGESEPGDDDTSPEVTAVRRTTVGTDPGPPPDDEVVVLDEDATGAMEAPPDDHGPEDRQLDLDELEEEPEEPRPVLRMPSYAQGGDDLDAWSSFATSGPRWRDQPRRWEEEDEARTSVPAGGRRRRSEEGGRRRRRWAEPPRPEAEAGTPDAEELDEEEGLTSVGRHPSEDVPTDRGPAPVPDDDTDAERRFFGDRSSADRKSVV